MSNQKMIKFIGIFLFFYLSSTLAASMPKTMPPTVVQIISVQKASWQNTISAVGSLSAFDGTMLTPDVTGRVTQIYFKSGQYVEKSAPLVQLYPDLALADLDKAQAQFKLSQLDYLRNVKLYKQGFVDKSTLDKLKATMDSSQADIEKINANLKQLLVQAPFSGVIGLCRISVGDYLKPGDIIASLQSVDPIRVDFSVPEVYLGKLKIGNKIIITSRAFDGAYTGDIFALDSSVNKNTRSIDAQARIPNPNHTLVPGSFVEITINLENPQSSIVIPQTAIVYSDDGNFVYRVVDHKAVKTILTLGKKLADNQVIVEKGLNIGDIIVVAGQTKAHDGAPIMTAEEFKQVVAKMMTAKDKRD